MTASIVRLRPQDCITQDPAAMTRIYREMGPAAAEQVVNRAMGELTLSIAAAAKRVAERNLADVPGLLRRSARMADDLGMTTVSATATDAAACIDDYDATAFAAVWARLLRVAGSQLALSGDVQGRRV